MRLFLFLCLLTGLAVAEPPQTVLQRLLDGNGRFVPNQPQHPHLDGNWRSHLSAEQHPLATVLGCADSRVPPELLFDVGLGDLFVTRLAGNVITTDITGTIEYGIFHLHTPLVIVLGHEGCGAVTAAFGDYHSEPFPVQDLLKHIVPALIPCWTAPDRIHQGVELNVRQSVRELRCIQHYRQQIEAGTLLIVGGVYDLDTGRVRMVTE